MAKALRDYFTSSGQKQALRAYSEFATGTAWSIPHKMDLYGLSQQAFGGGGKLASFSRIYDHLVSHWQVFRPHGAEECWNAERIFKAIRKELSGFDQACGASLMSFDHQKRHSVMFSLNAFEGIKPNAAYPTMTVSKFLHFFNPSLFPIYDTAVVEKKVFARFGSDYRDYCNRVNLQSNSEGAAFLRNYICWASDLVTNVATGFMENFAGWLKEELPPKTFVGIDAAFLRTLYATAFEFTAIGAARVEGY